MSLAKLRLCNGEGALLEQLSHFLNFMKTNGYSVPNTRRGSNALFEVYIKALRREQMQRISEEKVARALPPLPKRLLL